MDLIQMAELQNSAWRVEAPANHLAYPSCPEADFQMARPELANLVDKWNDVEEPNTHFIGRSLAP